MENTNYFRKELQSLGFDTGVSTTPIIPIMCGESSTAKAMTTHLQQEGVMAGAIVFPMVAETKPEFVHRCLLVCLETISTMFFAYWNP